MSKDNEMNIDFLDLWTLDIIEILNLWGSLELFGC